MIHEMLVYLNCILVPNAYTQEPGYEAINCDSIHTVLWLCYAALIQFPCGGDEEGVLCSVGQRRRSSLTRFTLFCGVEIGAQVQVCLFL